MESVLQCDTFGSFDSFQQNDACFSSILEDFQDRTQLDFGFNFPGETLEFTETTSVGSSNQRRIPAVGEKRKIDSLENFWDSEYFLPSNDCNFVGTYSSQADYSYPTSSATENFDFNAKVKTLDNGISLDKSAELCTANHVHKKQKVEATSVSIPNISSPPFSQRPNSSPSSPQKSTKRRTREVVRRSTPIPILCPDASIPTTSSSSSSNSLSSDPTLIPNVFEFKKTISELDDTTRTVYRDTLLQLARNAESGVFEPSSHNNGMNFESLLMRMMFSFSVPSISPSFFSTAATAPNIDRSHLLSANHQNFYNNLQFVPIISSRPNSVLRHDGKLEATALPHPRADPFYQKNGSYPVPNFTLVKPFPIPISTTPIPSNTYRGANDNAKQTVISRHLPIRVL